MDYTKHEKKTLEKVTRLRSQWGAAKSQDERLQTANMLETALSKLYSVL